MKKFIVDWGLVVTVVGTLITVIGGIATGAMAYGGIKSDVKNNTLSIESNKNELEIYKRDHTRTHENDNQQIMEALNAIGSDQAHLLRLIGEHDSDIEWLKKGLDTK